MGDTLARPVTDKYSQQFESNKFRVGASGMQGWRKGMEDAHTTLLSMAPDAPDCSFYAVYDGHCGQSTARYCGNHLHTKLTGSSHFIRREYDKAMIEAFLSTDSELQENNKAEGSGCTAVSCLVTETGQIVCANAGDSRCVLSRAGKAVPLSFDHKPTNESEMARIQKAGGYVHGGRANGNLALSRAIGDFEFKGNPALKPEEQIITAKPDIISEQLQAEDDFIVLACDGIWDCMTNEDVVKFVAEELQNTTDLAAICEKTFDKCLAPCAPGIGCDNMTMIIVQFKEEFKKHLGLIPGGPSSLEQTVAAPAAAASQPTEE
eukprot:TRINITY_DN4621_c1_g1_i2.p1 TRINITY_DN4621_c1_g1~~TRINITY_DN4621_c1_g1_i2.p1  ORF type:complete len:320 (+),score=31.32 TRINITY_DN4621_c1_g1_i2:76-1035(+)